jgi:hypothetical protein
MTLNIIESARRRASQSLKSRCRSRAVCHHYWRHGLELSGRQSLGVANYGTRDTIKLAGRSNEPIISMATKTPCSTQRPYDGLNTLPHVGRRSGWYVTLPRATNANSTSDLYVRSSVRLSVRKPSTQSSSTVVINWLLVYTHRLVEASTLIVSLVSSQSPDTIDRCRASTRSDRVYEHRLVKLLRPTPVWWPSGDFTLFINGMLARLSYGIVCYKPTWKSALENPPSHSVKLIVLIDLQR